MHVSCSHGYGRTMVTVKSPYPVGQLVVVYVEMNVPTIHARVEDAQQALLSIPVACTGLQVALLPPNDPEMIIVNRSWERKFTSVSEILASSTLPPVRMGHLIYKLVTHA